MNDRRRGRHGRARLLAMLVVAWVMVLAALPSASGAVAGERTTGAGGGLGWVGGYHKPFDYDRFFDYMMNGCAGYVRKDRWAARNWGGETQEWYVNNSYHPAYDMNARGSGDADAHMAVYAIADGEVIKVTESGWPGGAIWVLHERAGGGTFTAVYGHVYIASGVRVGAQVSRGQKIGSIYDYAYSHLHFGINTGRSTASGVIPCSSWPSGQNPPLQGWVDPIDWLTANPLGSTVDYPGKPTNVRVSIDGTTATIRWGAAAGNGAPIAEYRATTTSGKNCSTGGGRRSCVITGLRPGTGYVWGVQARNQRGWGHNVYTERVVAYATPTAPRDVAAQILGDEAQVTWRAPASSNGRPITGYTVTAQPGGLSCAVAATARSCILSGFESDETYTFSVRAENAAGLSAPSSTTADSERSPSVPRSLEVDAAVSSAVVTWAPPSDPGSGSADELVYHVRTAPDVGSCTVFASEGALRCRLDDLEPGAGYEVSVQARWSLTRSALATTSFTTNRLPAGVMAPHAFDIGQDRASIEWTDLQRQADGAASVFGYDVDILDAAGNGVAGCLVPTVAFGCTVSGLQPSTTYEIVIEAVAEGASGIVERASFRTWAPAPSAPRNLRVEAGHTFLLLSWDAPAAPGPAATGHYAFLLDGEETLCLTVDEQSCAFGGLEPGVAYAVAVAATYTPTGFDIHLGEAASGVFTTTVPVAPSGPAIEVGAVTSSSATVGAPVADAGSAPLATLIIEIARDGEVVASCDALASQREVCEFSGLVADAAYELRAVATNSDGLPSPTTTLSFLTPSAQGGGGGEVGVGAPGFRDFAADPRLHRGHSVVLRLYWAVLAREPDLGGAEFWVDAYDRGEWDVRRIAAHFVVSDEFVERYGAQSDREFTQLIYANVLEREPDGGGFAYWVGQLEGGMSRSEMVLLISNDDEFVANHPLPGDARADAGPMGAR